MLQKIFSILSLSLFFSYAQANTSLITDQDYLPTLLRELQKAQSNINILAFSFAIDNGQGQIEPTNPAYLVAQKLISLKKEKGEGLTIHLYLEGERSTLERNKITGTFLEQAGIIVKYGSTHAKGFSIDHKTILFGSTNLTSQSMLKNNETNILSDDPLITNGFDLFFDNLYNEGKIGSILLDPPMLADGAYKAALIKAIQLAQKSIEFSIYYFNDTDIENEIIKASQKGVHVRGYFNQREIPGSNLVERNRQTVERMIKMGVTDLHFAKDNAFTHSKYLILDQKEIYLGTGNWNYSDVNNYRQLYVKLEDLFLAKELSEHLTKQILEESR